MQWQSESKENGVVIQYYDEDILSMKLPILVICHASNIVRSYAHSWEFFFCHFRFFSCLSFSFFVTMPVCVMNDKNSAHRFNAIKIRIYKKKQNQKRKPNRKRIDRETNTLMTMIHQETHRKQAFNKISIGSTKCNATKMNIECIEALYQSKRSERFIVRTVHNSLSSVLGNDGMLYTQFICKSTASTDAMH